MQEYYFVAVLIYRVARERLNSLVNILVSKKYARRYYARIQKGHTGNVSFRSGQGDVRLRGAGIGQVRFYSPVE